MDDICHINSISDGNNNRFFTSDGARSRKRTTREKPTQVDFINVKEEHSECALGLQVFCNLRLDCFVLIISLKRKKVSSQSKERLTCLNIHTESCTHLLVSEPVGNCHMPGRFCSLGRWRSTIRPTISFNQSLVRRKKNADLPS